MKKFSSAFLSAVSTLSIFGICTFAACSKSDDCYSEVLYEKHKNDVCPTDNCKGLIGCDGKTYCNMCDATKHGLLFIRQDPSIEP